MLHRVSVRSAFWWSYAIGFVFFLASMWWLIHVTLVGLIVLCAYLGLYFGLFGLIVSRVFTHHPAPSTHHLLLVPAAWVAVEFLRTHLLSGLGWNLLAYSQTSWRQIIQFADVTGAWGVSFLIVMVNVAIAALLHTRGKRRGARGAGLVAAGALLVVLGYGLWRLPWVEGGPRVRIAVVQGNVPQEEKWDEAFEESILQRYEALTKAAAATEPDLIVWPETAVPGYLGIDEELTQRVIALVKAVRHPLLVGAPVPTIAQERVVLLNSAMLLGATGQLAARYDKVHLVPFGEFVPFERALPWLREVLPPIGDFSPGHDYTVFQTPVASGEWRVASRTHPSPITHHPSLHFSVLICFEDVFPHAARRFVLNGARLLIVITNDAWFGPTAAAYQHAQASTFRAIELRVPVARAANTGWSGCIDATGRWVGSVRDPSTGAELFVPGTHTCELPAGPAVSIYRQWGDWFAMLCLLGILGFAISNSLSTREL